MADVGVDGGQVPADQELVDELGDQLLVVRGEPPLLRRLGLRQR
ncbi:hypothetical protein OG604_03670 [Streptomyces sp. NBC_01231]|nr:hypothetical protein OG604_03670 [Streptomyces sp. NBC_01231]